MPAIPTEPRAFRAFAAGVVPRADLTVYGWVLFVLGLSLFASGREWGRFRFGGLLVHPYLLVVGMTFPLVWLSRLHLFPVRLTLGLLSFAALYFASTFAGGVAISEGVKIGASVVTIITVALLVRNWNDFVAGSFGMCMAAAALAVTGMNLSAGSGEYGGTVEAIDNANRNAYSLYALPPFLLGGFALLNGRRDAIVTKALLAVALTAVALAICVNVNRSGWLGLALVVVLLTYDKSFKAAAIFGILGGVVGWLVVTYFGLGAAEERITATRSGLLSDATRGQLILNAFLVGFGNPMLGVSAENLSFELARRLGYSDGQIETHNVFAHLAGGSGFICLLLMIYCGSKMWRFAVPAWLPPHAIGRLVKARMLLRFLLILWVVRGMFTHEIIYSPSFNMALGLCLGWCLCSIPPRPEQRRVAPNYRSQTEPLLS